MIRNVEFRFHTAMRFATSHSRRKAELAKIGTALSDVVTVRIAVCRSSHTTAYFMGYASMHPRQANNIDVFKMQLPRQYNPSRLPDKAGLGEDGIRRQN